MRTSLKPILFGKKPTFTVQEPICRSTRMSFLPLLFQRRFLARSHREVLAEYPIQTVIQFLSTTDFLGKIKNRHISTLIIGGSVNSRFKSDAHM